MYSRFRKPCHKFLFVICSLWSGILAAAEATEGSMFQEGARASVAATAPIVITRNPTADAYVRDGSSYENKNFGTEQFLIVKAANTEQFRRRAYLKFGIAGLSGTIVSAKLRLYGGNDSASGYTGKDDAYGVEDTAWSETGITWNNKPALDAKLFTTTITSTKQYYEWDVTAFVKAKQGSGQGAVSFGLAMQNSPPNDKFDVFYSREGAAPPQLVLTVDTNSASIAPVADAYVRDGSSYANQNFGTANVLIVKEASTAQFKRFSYLKFDISSFSGRNVATAKLRLYGGNASNSGYSGFDQAYGIFDTAWTETGITWNNKPVAGSLLDTVNITSQKQYYEWDVGAYVKANQGAGKTLISFAIAMTQSPANDDYDIFNSREASSNNPQLVLTFE